MTSVQLYQKLKPFLSVKPCWERADTPWQVFKLEDRYGKIVWAHTLVSDAYLRFNSSSRRFHDRPTYEQFCIWYRLDLEAL